MRKRHLATAMAMAAAMMTAAMPASAATAPAAAATPPALSDFVLEPTNGNLQGIVNQLDAELPKLGVQNILEQANRTDAPKGADCKSPALDTMKWPLARKFCFNAGDNATPEWMPQGITTVADAQEDQKWGTKQAILVSWYDKQDAPKKGVRVSFLDPDTGNYQHVLLAYPYTNTYGNPSYEALTTPQAGDGSSVHAGGIAWYGNYLYVADTRRGIRVFDMRYIFDIKSATNGDVTDSKQMGRQSGKYYSHGYRYVMPQVAGYSNPGGLATFPAEHKCNPSGPQKFSYLALDRSPTPDTLVTGEYCAKQADPNTFGRVAEWPMDGNTGKPKLDSDGKWRAAAAHRLSKPRVQGAVPTVGRWYLSSTGNGDTGPGYLEAAKGIGVLVSDSTEQEVAIGVEDLSFWPGQNDLWTVTEHVNKRIIYSTPRP